MNAVTRSPLATSPLAALLLSSVVILIPSAANAERVYEIFDLGTGGGSSYATSINEWGQVTGSYSTGVQGADREAFRWQRDFTPMSPYTTSDLIEDGVMTGLGSGSFPWTAGYVINDAGIVGGTTTSPIGAQPLRFDSPGIITTYGNVAPAGGASQLGPAIGIDNTTGRVTFANGYTVRPGDSAATYVGSLSGFAGFGETFLTDTAGGTLVGYSEDDDAGATRAVLWRSDIGLTSLHPQLESRLGPLYNSFALGISTNGHIVGISQVEEPDFGGGPGGGDGPSLNVLTPAAAVGDFDIGDIPPPPGGDEETDPPFDGPVRIDTGIIAWMIDPAPGGIGPPNVVTVGPVTEDGIEYSSFTAAIANARSVNAVNNYGHTVGAVSVAEPEAPFPVESAFLYRDNRQVLVRDLLPEESGWNVQHVTDINDRGEIVGTGINPEGQQRAFLMRLAAPEKHTQGDSTWGSDRLIGDARYSMADFGCFVTSTAMLLSTYGYDIDPQQLNNYLTSTGRFTNGDINFASMPRTTDWGLTGVEPGLDLTFNFAGISGATRDERVDELEVLIEEFGPVILRVPYYSAASQGFSFANGTHAIVAYRVDEDGTVWVRDPGSAHSGTGEFGVDTLTLEGYIAYENGRRQGTGVLNPLSTDLAWLNERTVTYASVVDGPTMRAVTESEIDFVITDPLGRRLGYDPTANGGEGEFYDEIPGGFYELSDAIGSVDGSDTTDPDARSISVILNDILNGLYDLQVFANEPGDWSLDLGESTRSGGYNPSQRSFSGSSSTAGSAGVFSFTVSVVPEPHTAALAATTLLCIGRRRKR